jgi:hypothetical protein
MSAWNEASLSAPEIGLRNDRSLSETTGNLVCNSCFVHVATRTVNIIVSSNHLSKLFLVKLFISLRPANSLESFSFVKIEIWRICGDLFGKSTSDTCLFVHEQTWISIRRQSHCFKIKNLRPSNWFTSRQITLLPWVWHRWLQKTKHWHFYYSTQLKSDIRLRAYRSRRISNLREVSESHKMSDPSMKWRSSAKSAQSNRMEWVHIGWYRG